MVGGILGSAGESALRSLVNKEYYVKARSINEGRDASAQIIGSPIAGFLYGVTQALPFVVSAIGNLIDLITTLFLPKLPPTSEAATQDSRLVKKVPFFSRAMAGFTWIARSRQMIGLTLIAAFSNFGSFLVVISVTLYLLSLGISTTVIGLLSTAEAVGALIGSALTTRISDKLPTGRLTLWANLISFAALAPIIFTQHPIAIGICYFIWGLPVAANSAAMGGYKFQMVSTDMQGRVTAADTLLVGLPVALTSIIGGILVDAGLAIVSIAIGVAFAFLALTTLGWERSILHIPRPSDWPDELPR